MGDGPIARPRGALGVRLRRLDGSWSRAERPRLHRRRVPGPIRLTDLSSTKVLGAHNGRMPKGTPTPTVGFSLSRSLINVLGEDHYPYAEYLYHELAANSYDADATTVWIEEETLVPTGPGRSPVYDITVRDDGNGMDVEGLADWFRLGDSSKVEKKVSERFRRPLIGKIGVGKVSILKVAREWTIETERHLGLPSPQRVRVHVNVDEWIKGNVQEFAIEELEPAGTHGTQIKLHGVRTRLRKDRIIRHVQRLPLMQGKNDFKVFRDGELIKPRAWWGDSMTPIDARVEWEENAERRSGRVRGEIWIRPLERKRDRQAYIEEPAESTDKDAARDPAGLQVIVNGDSIVQEFFGRETHGHGINRIWGWVEADFLPILGNRTGYQRDHPAGVAFLEAVGPFYDRAFDAVKRESQNRTNANRNTSQAGSSGTAGSNGTSGEAGTDESGGSGRGDQRGDEGPDRIDGGEKPPPGQTTASRYAEGLYEVLQDKPELAPIVTTVASRTRGRPAKDRIYPARSTGTRKPFLADEGGERRARLTSKEVATVESVVAGEVTDAEDEFAEILEELEIASSTTAGISLTFSSLGGLEGPYRWNLGDPSELSLDINTDHALYRAAGRPGLPLHRMLCAWLVSMAIAEQRRPRVGAAFADEVDSLCHELFSKWEYVE